MKPTFLFVHGFGCDRQDWRMQVEALEPEFEVMTLDLPGHGEAPLPAIADLNALALAVVEAKSRCAAPVVLVGHSMGCRVVLETLRLSPSGVAGLVLVDGSATGREHGPRLVTLLEERLRVNGMQASLRRNVEEMFNADSPSELRESAVATALRLDPAFAEQILRGLAQWDAAEALAPLAASSLPVLAIQATALGADMRRRSLLAGETSPWGRLVKSLRPDAKMLDIAGVGHFVHLESANEVNEALVAFGHSVASTAEQAARGS